MIIIIIMIIHSFYIYIQSILFQLPFEIPVLLILTIKYFKP